MHASDLASTVHDRQTVLREPVVGACIRDWLYCGGPGMSLLRFVGSEVDCRFVRCYEEVEYERDFSTLMWQFKVQPLPKIGLSLIVLRRPSSHLYFAKCFD